MLKDHISILRRPFAIHLYTMAMSGAEDLDLFGFQPNSQVPGAWMGAAYAFFNSIERDEKIKQKDSSKPAAECADVKLSSKRSTISRSRSRSRD